MPRRVITTEEIHAARGAREIRIPEDALVTDAARELARDLGIGLLRRAPPERPFLVGANWKMNLPPTGVGAFAQRLVEALPPAGPRVAIFPPDLVLRELQEALAGSRVEVGVQDLHPERSGAYTGETSGAIAGHLGAGWCLVGHSERRRLAGETDEVVAAKLSAALEEGLRPVLCVGETEREREQGRTLAVLRRQLAGGLERLTWLAGTGLAVAYEPVWAIGTGRTPTPEDAGTVHGWIRAELVRRFGEPARETPILYGGSVTPEVAAAMMGTPDLDGYLVGGASLDALRLAGIVAAGRGRDGGAR